MHPTNQKLLLACGVFAFMCCNTATNQSEQTTQTDTTVADTSHQMSIQIPQTICYTTKNSKDTIRLKVERFPNVVTGTLEYNLFEKDKNKGGLEGKLFGDTLIADYTFMSEGTKSVRQVAFLLSDSLATEGYADMEEKDGKLNFKNTGKLDFSKGTKLYTIACATE